MLNENELLILQLFFHNPSEYLTSQEIGSRLGVSDKTTRKYLKELNEVMDDSLAEIKSVRGYGNHLIIHDDKKFRSFYQENLIKNQSTTDPSDVTKPQERRNYLLRNLFFENEVMYFQELLDEFYITETPLLHDIAAIKSLLKPFDLQLKNSKDKGLYLVGEEQNKRHFIMSYFLINQYQNNQKSFEQIGLILKNVHLEEILIIVLDEYRNAHLTLNDTIILNVAIHIALALMRVEHGYQINSSSCDEYLQDSKEVQAAKNIIRRLEKSTGVTLPEEEIYNIALHLKNKQSLEYMLTSQNIEESELRLQIIEGLRKLEEQTGYPYSQDKILVDGLMTHFVPLILRIQNQGMIQNPFLEEIRKNYPELFEKIIQSLSQIALIQKEVLSDDEWAYIALHVIAAHERQVNREKTNVLVICATGLGSSQMIGARLKNELGSKINVQEIISYYEITEDKLVDIDLIISTIDVSNTVFNVPIVNVSVLLNEQDIQNINKMIAPIPKTTDAVEKKDSMVTRSLNIEEIIEEYFDADLFIYSEKITTKQEALDALVTQSVAQDQSIDRVFLENQLLLRESFSSVVFTENMAIPHPIEGVSNQSKVAVLLTPQGIRWDLGTSDIQLTLLLLPDRFGNQQIELVSQALLPLLDCSDSVNKLAQAKSYQEFKKELINILKK